MCVCVCVWKGGGHKGEVKDRDEKRMQTGGKHVGMERPPQADLRSAGTQLTNSSGPVQLSQKLQLSPSTPDTQPNTHTTER